MSLEDTPFGGRAHVVDPDGAVVGAHGQPLTLRVEGDHREGTDEAREDLLHLLVRVLPQRHVIGIETLEQDLHQLDHVTFQLRSELHDELPENLQDVPLVFISFLQTGGFPLDQRQEEVREFDAQLEEHLRQLEFQE